MATKTTSSSAIVSFNNAQHFISIKLTHENYHFWSTQVNLFLNGHNLMGFLDGSNHCPPSTHSNFAQWVNQDQLIMSLLISSLSEDVFAMLSDFETSHDIWITLKKALASPTNTHQLHSIEEGDQIINHVNHDLYQSIVDDNLYVFRQNKDDQFHQQITPNKNTLLHVVAQFHNSAEFVNEILDIQSSTVKQTMLAWTNSKGETSLHIASTNGHLNIVGELIRHAKALETKDVESCAKLAEKMMRTTDQNGDTALYMAVRSKHEEIVKLLVKEDPDFPHPSNKMEKTPLYLAVENGSHGMVDAILNTCRSPGYRGPRGRTALHAVVIHNYEHNFDPDCIAKLLEFNKDLTKEVDEFGWSPLHYAARFNRVECARKLLVSDASIAYITADKDDNKTSLHVAACHGNTYIIEVILEYCPDCWEMTTSKGQNIIHLAVDHEEDGTVNLLVSKPWAVNLVNGKDDEGNTPLHLYVTCSSTGGRSLVEHIGADTNAFNGKNLTPIDIVWHSKSYVEFEKSRKKQLKKQGGGQGYRDVIQRDRHSYRRMKEYNTRLGKELPENPREVSDVNLIVAALIATVTFAAGFTLPGGYDGNEGPNQGMAVLVSKAAFKAFVVSDTIAVMSSILAIFLHLVASGYIGMAKTTNRYTYAVALTLIASLAMTVAFMTGLYTVLAPSSLGLAITIFFFGCFCILIFFWVLGRGIGDGMDKERRYELGT